MSYPPRILRIVYRSNHHPRRVAEAYAKVPYAGVFALSDTLGRAMTTGEILWYRIERVAPKDIAKIRKGLVRWPEALAQDNEHTFVRWDL